MTATTTIPESHPTHSNRPLWAALAFALAAVIGVAAAVVVIDDDGSSAGRTAVERETTVANPSAVSVSADAAEARAVREDLHQQRRSGVGRRRGARGPGGAGEGPPGLPRTTPLRPTPSSAA